MNYIELVLELERAIRPITHPVLISGFVGATAWLFVAGQRAARLKKQLDQLADLISEKRSIGAQIWEADEARITVWRNALKRIQEDLERIPDRLVRLNATKQRALSEILSGYPDTRREMMANEKTSDQRLITTIEQHYLKQITAMRKSVSITSFIEL